MTQNSSGFEVTIDPKTATKEQILLERNKINEQREEARKLRLKAMERRRNRGRKFQNNQKNDELVNKFLKMFNNEFDIIEKSLPHQKSYQDFKNLKLKCVELENKINDSVRFLPSFTFETKTKQMYKLKQNIKNLQQQVKKSCPFLTLKR